MRRSEMDIQQLLDEIEQRLRANDLNSWSRRFLTDMRERLLKYGAETRLSSKQQVKLSEILSKAQLDVPSPVRGAKPRLAYTARRKTAKSPGSLGARYGKWKPWRALVISSLLVLLVVLLPQMRSHDSRESTAPPSPSIEVIDGDTVRVLGDARNTRLVGFNAPETIGPACYREEEIGLKAKERLRELVVDGEVELKKVRCACDPGTEGTRDCNFGRHCGILFVNGEDVSRILIREGLVVPFKCGRTSCPSLPRPWCQ